MAVLPPAVSLRLEKDQPSTSSVPLWLYWARIAHIQARAAAEAAPSDDLIDAMSAELAGLDPRGHGEQEVSEWNELFAGLVAVAAAAHAIDGFYGSVKPLLSPPPSRAKRPRQIMETIKLGFRVGNLAKRWGQEIDWLFETRDDAVHHNEAHRPTVVVRMTEETVVVGAPEVRHYSADTAARAADLAAEVLVTCLERPKSSTREWAEGWREREVVEKLRG